jgi:hypothetical protein
MKTGSRKQQNAVFMKKSEIENNLGKGRNKFN